MVSGYALSNEKAPLDTVIETMNLVRSGTFQESDQPIDRATLRTSMQSLKPLQSIELREPTRMFEVLIVLIAWGNEIRISKRNGNEYIL